MSEAAGAGSSTRRVARTRATLMLLRVLPQVSAPLTIGTAVAAVLAASLPIAFMLATGALIGSVPDAVRDGPGSDAADRVILLLVVAAAVFLGQQVVSPAAAALASALGRRVTGHVRARVMGIVFRPTGIAHLEDPAHRDDISLVRGVGPGSLTIGGAAEGFAGVMRVRLQGFASAAFVASFRWWLALALVVFWLAARRLLVHHLFKTVELMVGETQAIRRSEYLRTLAVSPEAAKESRVFGMDRWLVDRFNQHWFSAMREVWRERAAGWPLLLLAAVLAGGVTLLAYMLVARAGARGEISLGELAVLLQAVEGVAVLCNLSQHDLQVAHGLQVLPAVRRLSDAADRVQMPAGGAPATDLPAREIRFEGVSFCYPGSTIDIYRGLDLTIPAGSSLAIVGVNGAGKTTLVKLLARLYEPTAGRITVDGVPLGAIDPTSWQRRIGVIFQDFVRYPLPARDNVGFGAIELQGGEESGLREAAASAGATAVIERLPSGWDTVLSRQFPGGADLSGGEWQRIALARALYAVQAGAGVLVLDEPTANLDVRAEAELYDRFLGLTSGLTTIVISHRFSTVRHADRICVLDEGRVVEEGSHDELLRRNGRYAEMFRLQAARFHDGADGRRADGDGEGEASA